MHWHHRIIHRKFGTTVTDSSRKQPVFLGLSDAVHLSHLSHLCQRHTFNKGGEVRIFCAQFIYLFNAGGDSLYMSVCLNKVTSVIEVNVLWNLRVRPHLASTFEVILTVARA